MLKSESHKDLVGTVRVVIKRKDIWSGQLYGFYDFINKQTFELERGDVMFCVGFYYNPSNEFNTHEQFVKVVCKHGVGFIAVETWSSSTREIA